MEGIATKKTDVSRLLLLCFISGILPALPWYEMFSGIILFVAFVPLLFVEEIVSKERQNTGYIIRYALFTFSIWCALTGWWVKNASFVGMLFIIITHIFLLTLTFWLFHITKRKLGNRLGYFSLIVYWITFEHFFLNAEISFPWIILGNGFNKDIKLIQWYEHTGVLGGSLWILIVNIILFSIISYYIKHRTLKPKIPAIAALIIIITLPIIISLNRYSHYREEENPVTIICVQPNIDPYEKFITVTTELQTQILIEQTEKLIDQDVDYVVAPETAITNYAELGHLNSDPSIRKIKKFIEPYPNLKFIVGIFCRKYYFSEEKATKTASQYGNSNIFYDTFNTAIQIDSTDSIQYYHKSQLFVGVEKMPYPKTLKFLKKLTVKLGGTFRSLATQEERSNLISPEGNYRVAPVICWENVFGEYVTGYIKKGANLIFIMTNEGWWGDTPGYKLLNHYSQLRAIETRRSIARSANTGITSFINQKGEVLDSIGWWKKDAIKGILHANNTLTFYVIHGDYIARIARVFALLTGLMVLINHIIYKKKK